MPGSFIIQHSYIRSSAITLTPALSQREGGLLTGLFPENEKPLGLVPVILHKSRIFAKGVEDVRTTHTARGREATS